MRSTPLYSTHRSPTNGGPYEGAGGYTLSLLDGQAYRPCSVCSVTQQMNLEGVLYIDLDLLEMVGLGWVCSDVDSCSWSDVLRCHHSLVVTGVHPH